MKKLLVASSALVATPILALPALAQTAGDANYDSILGVLKFNDVRDNMIAIAAAGAILIVVWVGLKYFRRTGKSA